MASNTGVDAPVIARNLSAAFSVDGRNAREPAKIRLLRQLVNVQRMDHAHAAQAGYTHANVEIGVKTNEDIALLSTHGILAIRLLAPERVSADAQSRVLLTPLPAWPGNRRGQ